MFEDSQQGYCDTNIRYGLQEAVESLLNSKKNKTLGQIIFK